MKPSHRISPLPTLHPFRLLLTGAVCVLAACRYSRTPETLPLALSQRVAWEGKTASRYSDSAAFSAGDSAPLWNEGLVRIHSFEFASSDTVRLQLREYRNAYQAFARFQKSASPWEMEAGNYQEGKALVFQHANFVGRLTCTQAGWDSAGFLKEKLSFRNEDLFSKPGEFTAFPLLGRIPNSERVISEHFLGRTWNGPVFSVAYRCHADTGTAFRALVQAADSVQAWMQDWRGKNDTLAWGREIHFQGRDEFRRPLILWVFPEGLMGFAGCSDPVLAGEYALKMQKTAVLWPKP